MLVVTKAPLLKLTLILALVIGATQSVSGRQCKEQRPSSYEGLVISAVEISSTDPLFQRVRDRLPKLLTLIPLSTQSRFKLSDYNDARDFIVGDLTIVDPPEFHLAVVKPTFSECPGNNTFKLTFDVSFVTPESGSPIYEQAAAGRGRGRPGWITSVLNVISPQPYAGFTGTRNYMGAGATIDLKNEFVENFTVEGGGSPSNAMGAASVGGSSDFDLQGLRSLKWSVGYDYSNLPAADTSDIKRGTVYAQFAAMSRTFGGAEENAFRNLGQKKGLVIRYGGAVEGGNRQSDVSPNVAPPTVVPDAGYGALKAYLGGSWNIARHRFKASYGFQVGDTRGASGITRRRIDYFKHILDAGYKTQFLPWRNRPVALETQLTGGKIVRHGAVPLAERFFEGNVEQNFIADDDWVIRAAPFIRSIPRRLSQAGTSNPFGGESFVSMNITVAATAWAKPAIDREIQEVTPEAYQLLKNHPKAQPVRDALASAFASDTEGYVERIAKAEFGELRREVTALGRELTAVSKQDIDEETETAIDECISVIRETLSVISSADKKIALDSNDELVVKGTDASIDLRELVEGFSNQPPYIPEVIRTLNDVLARNEPLLDTARPQLEGHKRALGSLFTSMKKRYDDYQKEDFPVAMELGKKFLDSTQGDIGQLGRELNKFAIGPIFMFDASRVRSGGANDNFRYGIGTGAQVSFFGLEFRGGYSFNPDRRPGEARGALVFRFGVSDLFQ